MPPPTDTVTVRASANVRSVENAAVTVTGVDPSPSLTLDGLTDRFTAGAASLSVSVNAVPFTVTPPATPATSMVSRPSTAVSRIGRSLNVPAPMLAPPGIVMSKLDTAA